MKRDHRRWHSPRLGRDMELLVFGHTGAKVLMWPTRDGFFWEYEAIGVIERLRPKVEAGHLQLFAIEGLARETFYARDRHPAERIRRHAALEAYILHEVMPLMAALNRNPTTIAFGCSLGAYQAATMAFRHPHLFRKLVALSGRFDLTRPVEHFADLLDGHYDDEVYFHTPTHFLANLAEAWRLEHLRAMDIVLAVGAADPFLPDNRRLAQLLRGKHIAHQLHVWEGRAHRASAWRHMAMLYV